MAINTISDLKAASTKELLDFYNETTGKMIKKFSSRKAALAQTSKLLKVSTPKARRMRFRFAPKNEIRSLRVGSKRAKVQELLSNPKGILFAEVMTAFGWGVRNTYEAIRLVHSSTGCGMWHEVDPSGDLRIYIVNDPQEYKKLLGEEKKAA